MVEERVSEYESVMYLTVRRWERDDDDAHFTCVSTNSLGKSDGTIQAYSAFSVAIRPANRGTVPTGLLELTSVTNSAFEHVMEHAITGHHINVTFISSRS